MPTASYMTLKTQLLTLLPGGTFIFLSGSPLCSILVRWHIVHFSPIPRLLKVRRGRYCLEPWWHLAPWLSGCYFHPFFLLHLILTSLFSLFFFHLPTDT